MGWTRSVYSSNVDTVEYRDDGHLLVTWQKGKTSIYGPGITEEKALAVANAHSVTQAINETIKPHHDHRYA